MRFRRRHAFTLVEVLIGSSLAAIVLAAVLTGFLYLGRSMARLANYQTLGYLVRDRMVLLQPRRKTEVFRVDADKNIVAPVDDPQALREAIAFYSAASYVFHSGLYRDEE